MGVQGSIAWRCWLSCVTCIYLGCFCCRAVKLGFNISLIVAWSQQSCSHPPNMFCNALSLGLCVCMKLRGVYFFPSVTVKKEAHPPLPVPPPPFSFFIYLYIYLFLDLCASTLCLLIASAPLPGSLRGRGCEPQMPLCEHTNSRSRQGCLSGGETVGGETSLGPHRDCRTMSRFATRHEGGPPAFSSHTHPTWPLATLFKTASLPRTRACFAKCRMLPRSRSWRGIWDSWRTPGGAKHTDATVSTASAAYCKWLRKARDSQRNWSIHSRLTQSLIDLDLRTRSVSSMRTTVASENVHLRPATVNRSSGL